MFGRTGTGNREEQGLCHSAVGQCSGEGGSGSLPGGTH